MQKQESTSSTLLSFTQCFVGKLALSFHHVTCNICKLIKVESALTSQHDLLQQSTVSQNGYNQSSLTLMHPKGTRSKDPLTLLARIHAFGKNDFRDLEDIFLCNTPMK